MSQQCKKCLTQRPLAFFEIDKKTGRPARRVCKECRNAREREYRVGDRQRKKRLWGVYKITLDDYNNMLIAQNNVCAICFNKNTSGPWKGLLAVDHCHKTGKVRGLLCDSCNRGIGQLKDDIELVKNAVGYLEKHI